MQDQPLPSSTSSLQPIRSFNALAIRPPRDFKPFEIPVSFAPAHVDVEIGCGVGWHPIRYALENQDRLLIAIEQTKEKFTAFRKRLSRHPALPNLQPVHADAIAWITHALPAESISRCFLLYPNPEAKNASRRWFRMPFMARLRETLKPGGELVLATNIASYADEACIYAREAWNLALLDDRTIRQRTDADFRPRTHFERKYLRQGQTCRLLTFRK